MKGSPAGDTQVSAQGSEFRSGAGTPERTESLHGSCALGRVLWVCSLTLEVPGDCWPFTSSLVLRPYWPWCPHLPPVESRTVPLAQGSCVALGSGGLCLGKCRLCSCDCSDYSV